MTVVGMTGVAPDVVTLAGRCHELLVGRNETVATAESLTGGLLGAALTERSGTSASFRSGVIAYAVDQKAALLGVSERLLAEVGPVHPDTASAMAVGVRERLSATHGLATTGVAGPEPHGDRPVGTVYIAWAGPDGGSTVRHLRLSGTRQQIRDEAVRSALDLLRSVLEDTQESVSACRPGPGYGGSQIQGDRVDDIDVHPEPGER